MRRTHFDALRPICPSCLLGGRNASLCLGWVAREQKSDGVILEGALQCEAPDCQLEFPIVDGIPILVPDPRAYVADNAYAILQRTDLSPVLGSMVAECSGPGSHLDVTRLHLSSYCWDHFAEFDPEEPAGDPKAGSVARALDQTLSLVSNPRCPVLDAGCSVGRTSFELAERLDGLVLGVDLNLSMLRLAQSILLSGRMSYERRRFGMLYEHRDFAVRFQHADRIDFWACDAACLPFADGTFGMSCGFNLLDSSAAPLDVLKNTARVLETGGTMTLTCPYDWSGAVTTPDCWIGGHSPRGYREGSGAEILKDLLTEGRHPASIPGVEVVGERDDVPWIVRMHERSYSNYRLQILAASITA